MWAYINMHIIRVQLRIGSGIEVISDMNWGLLYISEIDLEADNAFIRTLGVISIYVLCTQVCPTMDRCTHHKVIAKRVGTILISHAHQMQLCLNSWYAAK